MTDNDPRAEIEAGIEAAMRAAYDRWPQVNSETRAPLPYEAVYGSAPLDNAEDRAEMEVAIAAYLSRVSLSRVGSVAAYERANERLEAALLHIINRVSTEGRDDEHKHLFLVGSEAVKHARAEIAAAPSRVGSVAVEDVAAWLKTAPAITVSAFLDEFSRSSTDRPEQPEPDVLGGQPPAEPGKPGNG
jgi:hypothetical protein